MVRATNVLIVGQQAVVLRLVCKKLRTVLRTQFSMGRMSGKVPRGLVTPPVYSFRHSSPRYFSPLLLSAPFPDIRGVEFSTCLPYLHYLTSTPELVLTYWEPERQCSAPE